MTAATSIGTLAGALHAFTDGTTTYSAKPPFTSTPRIRVFSQTWALPVRQAWQWLQTRWLSQETRSPTRNSVTPCPISTISPTNSCPSVTGGLMRLWDQPSQAWMWRSVPHTPARLTLSSSWLAPQVGTGTCRISAPGAAAALTTARMVRARVEGEVRGVAVGAGVVGIMARSENAAFP